MPRTFVPTIGALLAGFLLAPAPIAVADPVAAGPCTPAVDGATTLSPEGGAPELCQDGRWLPIDLPAPASDRWASFNTLTLHGQGLQNPGVLAGQWTATPLGEPTRCQAEQQTVVSPGTLSKPMVEQGAPNAPLTIHVLPTAFYVHLSGNCLWIRQP